MHENRETSSAPVEQTGRSEKALCRTADMYALEESDRCVVPMKQLNKEGNLRRRLWREGGDPRRTLHYLARARLRAGNLCHRGRAECADSSTPLSKGRAVCGNSARTDLCGVVSRTCSQEHDAVSKMKGGPSESACRSRFQTTVSCWGGKAAGGERCGKGAAFDRVMCR
jgi:hypothetical protein